MPLRRPSTLVRLVNMLSIAAAAFAYNIAPVPAPHAVVPATAAARACRIAMEEGVASLPPTAAQKTWFPKSADTAKSAKKWFVVDAEGLRLGRMSSEVAKILLGKNKATYTPGADVGDAVVIVNAEKIIVTGNKRKEKLYRRHSGRPGGMKIESFEELQVRNTAATESAVQSAAELRSLACCCGRSVAAAASYHGVPGWRHVETRSAGMQRRRAALRAPARH